MQKAIFLDRDGTINVEKHYLNKIEDFEFLPGVIEGLKLFQDDSYILIIITNQSGIGRGYYSEENFKILNDRMVENLKDRGVIISAVYYCPHLPDAKIEKYRVVCECRKPALGMYNKAIEDFNIDIDQSWAIGDKIRDCSICKETGCRGFLIGNNEKKEVIEAVKSGKFCNIDYAQDLYSAAKTIVEV